MAKNEKSAFTFIASPTYSFSWPSYKSYMVPAAVDWGQKYSVSSGVSVSYNPNVDWGQKASDKLTLNLTDFVCQQCNKPVYKIATDNNLPNMTTLFKFYCHGEVYTVTVSNDLLDALHNSASVTEQIIKLVGPLFGNTDLDKLTHNLLSEFECLVIAGIKEKYDPIFNQLKLLALNSTQCLKRIRINALNTTGATRDYLRLLLASVGTYS